MTELKSITTKTIITAVDILLTPYLKLQAVIFVTCTSLNFYWHISQVMTVVAQDQSAEINPFICIITCYKSIFILVYVLVASVLHGMDELPTLCILCCPRLGFFMPCNPALHRQRNPG